MVNIIYLKYFNSFRSWLVWQSDPPWKRLTLWVNLKLLLDQTMLEGEAIAAFRASPLKAEPPKLSSSFLAGLAIWPRLDNANTLGNTEVNFGADDA